MIPILYENTETDFVSNGICRLRSCISCTVTEERNGVYECDFTYPMSGANFDEIKIGRIIGVTHDDNGDVQPFDIVSYSRPIDGIVEFHCTHISYRQNYITVTASNIGSLDAAFTQLMYYTTPTNPFTYETGMNSSGNLPIFDGVPKTVRSVLGGAEGSILDTYGGEYEWDKWTVSLYSSRGTAKDFSIRYGVNMLDYKEEFDVQGTYMQAIPYWKGSDDKRVGGGAVLANGATLTNHNECVPLDLSDKFDSKPGMSDLMAKGAAVISAKNPHIPTQTIHVEFARLQDLGYSEFEQLLTCSLCDTINVVFPDYDSSGQFKIVKVVWDALADRYESMELGDLSITLAQSMGVSSGSNSSTAVGYNPRGWFYVNGMSVATISTASSYVQVPITGIAAGSGFSYDSGTDGIKCTKGSLYAVSVQLQMATATSGDLIGVAVYKNGTIALGPAYMRMGGNYDSAILMPTYISLDKGDVLTVYIRNNSAGRGATDSTGNRIMCWEV